MTQATSTTSITTGLAEIQRRGMFYAILAQSVGCLSMLAFQNNQVLLYLSALGLRPTRIVIYLALPWLTDTLLRLPSAVLADRWGKKRVGTIGLWLTVLGMVAMTAAPQVGGWRMELAVVAGIVVHWVGMSAFVAGWYALLSPIVPLTRRGHFFGTLRFTWQIVAIAFAVVVGAVMTSRTPLWIYQVLLGVLVVTLLFRLVAYSRLPELEPSGPRAGGLRAALTSIVRAPGYASFCPYIFLLSLFTMGCPPIFGLVETKVMHLGDSLAAWMGVFMMTGMLGGFFLGGKAIDRMGTKPIFLICHFLFGLVLLLYVLRGLAGPAQTYAVATLRLLFGAAYAASTVAISTEMLALVPPENKALSTSICMTLYAAGPAMGGLLAGWVLDAGMLHESWTLAGLTLSRYDSLLLGCGLMILLLVVTLGLVPSVIGKTAGTRETD